MKATEILSKEHELILSVAEAIENECDEIESKDKKFEEDFFKKIIDFIENYADKFHHVKEEDILFKELCKPDVEMHCNPVEQMLIEHDSGRDFVKEIKQGLKEKNKKKIIEGARGYSQLMKEHIYKEDNILYPMANQFLKDKTKKEILEKFEKQIKEKDNIKKKYIFLVKELSRG